MKKSKLCESCPYRYLCQHNDQDHMYSRTKHHLFFPKRAYRTRLERKFRQHPKNIQYLCRRLHDLIHIYEKPPEKPTVKEMREFLRLNPV